MEETKTALRYHYLPVENIRLRCSFNSRSTPTASIIERLPVPHNKLHAGAPPLYSFYTQTIHRTNIPGQRISGENVHGIRTHRALYPVSVSDASHPRCAVPVRENHLATMVRQILGPSLAALSTRETSIEKSANSQFPIGLDRFPPPNHSARARFSQHF